MTTEITYRKLRSIQKVYPCLNTLGYMTVGSEVRQYLKLPVEHRVKPSPLTLTARALQYNDVRTVRCERETTHPAYGCAGGLVYGTQTVWSYALPTQPIVPCEEPNWALALRNKIQDDKYSFAEQIGEWREAITMMGDGIGVMRKAMRTVKRMWRQRRHVRHWRKWFKTTFQRDPRSKWELQDAASVDLMIKFGIKPIVSSIWDISEKLDEVLQKSRRVQVTLRTRGSYVASGPYGGTYAVDRERSTRAIAYVTYDMDNRDFTSGNIGEALWAGTKLSFIVDWFWDVSSYLSSFNALKGVTSLTGVICQRDTTKGVDRRIQFGKDYRVEFPGTWVKKSYKRDVINLTNIPLASLPKFKLPDTDLWARWLTLREILGSIRHKNRTRV